MMCQILPDSDLSHLSIFISCHTVPYSLHICPQIPFFVLEHKKSFLTPKPTPSDLFKTPSFWIQTSAKYHLFRPRSSYHLLLSHFLCQRHISFIKYFSGKLSCLLPHTISLFLFPLPPSSPMHEKGASREQRSLKQLCHCFAQVPMTWPGDST